MPPTLMDGSVLSVKDEWSLVVGNFGETQGVKIGMPLRVMRGDRVIDYFGHKLFLSRCLGALREHG
ncbi:MAG: hypothetical protein M3Y03_04720, partial [Verrucomicrobiota bacterium]|nr:hypothetical protein [Verrucomicrobiota bacterium]